MEEIKITPEIIQAASTYIPLMKKSEIATSCAEKCIDFVEIKYKGFGDEMLTAPCMRKENECVTRIVLMSILVQYYLNLPYEKNTEYEDCKDIPMPAHLYDKWAESNVVGQIERMRNDKAYGIKIQNMIADYRDMRNMLYREIESLLATHNDSVWRMKAVLEQQKVLDTQMQSLADGNIDSILPSDSDIKKMSPSELASTFSTFQALADQIASKFKAIKESAEEKRASMEKSKNQKE